MIIYSPPLISVSYYQKTLIKKTIGYKKKPDITPVTARIKKVSLGRPNKIYPKLYIHDIAINNFSNIVFMKYSPLKELLFSLLTENSIRKES